MSGLEGGEMKLQMRILDQMFIWEHSLGGEGSEAGGRGQDEVSPCGMAPPSAKLLSPPSLKIKPTWGRPRKIL